MDDDDMAWLHFTADFDWHPTPRSTIAYRAGMKACVKRACVYAAVAAGKADEIDAPPSANTEQFKPEPEHVDDTTGGGKSAAPSEVRATRNRL